LSKWQDRERVFQISTTEKIDPAEADHPEERPEERDIVVGRRVLNAEAAALHDLADSLGADFSAAVETLLDVKGRVIVSGLGKSGHIARKITATLASTGTPAQHVHPSEASHGDLGMITGDDAVIMLSNSGENRELSDLIAHTRLVGIPLIGISSKPESTLIRSSDIGLILVDAPEACPMGKAPTTSSTMMLALGDALGVALMERRGFDIDNYRVLHPGGKLGQSLVRVSEVMHQGDAIPLITGDATMADLIRVKVEKRKGCIGILDEAGLLIGIFTDGDLGRSLDDQLMSKTAFDVMTRSPKTISGDALVVEAVALMQKHNITALFASGPDGGSDAIKPVGIIHMHDCIKAGFS
jgi:arabinose-5-phosphate isomerase